MQPYSRIRAPRAPNLRILFLAPQPFFEVRGTPLAVRAMVRALAAQGHQVELLTYSQGDDIALPGVRHRRSLSLPVGRVRAGPSLAKLLLDVPFMARAWWRMAAGRFDVVHAVEEAAHLAAPVARLLGLPLVVDVDSSIPAQMRESGFAGRGPLLWAAEALEGHALRHSAAVVTVCASLTEGVRGRVPHARVFQVEDPPLLAAPASRADVAALAASLGLDDRPVVLYSGNFERYQGLELLVDAAAAVPEAQFVFMGGEADQVASMRGRAARGAACVFAGKRATAELPAFLGAAAVVVSPRVGGVNTPFKVYTYLASGRPMVATRILTHTQLLDDTVAWLVEPTPAGLAAGIRSVLADPGEARRRAARGLALVAREYSEARYAEKVAAAYAAIAAAIR
jgi:glycosyltransferase involved in cell wall biosynthesis